MPKRVNINKEPKKLYRSQKDKVIAGVCGGLGEYFNIDPVWIRLFAVLLIFADGIGLILYIAMWILVPKNPVHKESKKTSAEESAEKVISRFEKKGKDRTALFIGAFLIIIGLFFLVKSFFSWFNFSYIIAIIIILIGAFLMFRRDKNER